MSKMNPWTNPETRPRGEMHRTNLIQRLKTPWYREMPDGSKRDNPFSFGGGLRNGGLNEEAMALLREIFSFDYMGSAEFEFGAVPQALQVLASKAERGSLTTFSIAFTEKEVAPPWRKKAPLVNDHVYVICDASERDEVERRIRLAAAGKESYYSKPGMLSLKENTLLPGAMRGEEYLENLRGWLELDNGFFFFVDQEMFEKTVKLFGVKP